MTDLVLLPRGPAGNDGASFFQKTTNPAPSDGKDGDSWWNRYTGATFLKVNGAWQSTGTLKGQPGDGGQPGRPGTSVIFGNTPPPVSQGRAGDGFIYMSPFGPVIYGPRADSGWPTLGSPMLNLIEGAGPPSSSTGFDGQIYIDLLGPYYYAPKLNGAWGSPTAMVMILTGSGAPSNSLGINGQTYFDTVGQVIYGPKAGGAWSAGVSFAGAIANWTGTTWSSAVTYAKNDGVKYNGSSYVSLQNANANHQPDTATTWWQLVASKGDTGSIIINNLSAGTDLSTIVAVGAYDVNNPANGPGTGWWYLEVYPHTQSTNYVLQRATARDTGTIWGRVRVAGSWGAWTKVPDATDVAALTTSIGFDGQDIRALALMVSELKGDRLNMVDGIADPFSDASDVNSGTPTNYAFDATNKQFLTTRTAYATTPISGGDNPSHAKANAFDGTSSEWWSSQLDGAVNGAAYIGQDFGSGTTRDIRQVVLTNSQASLGNVTSVLVQYSDNLTSWTTAVTQSVSASGGVVSTIVVPSSGAHRAWRLLANSAPAGTGSGYPWEVAEVAFNGGINAMNLVSAAFTSDVTSPTRARVVAQIAAGSDTFTPNTDLIASVSRDGGTTFTAGTLAYVETLADGTKTYETGSFDISAQPAGSSMVWKLVTANGKDIRPSGVVMQWRP